MNTLQRVVQATLLNSTPFVDWYGDGVMASFQTDKWTVKEGSRGSSGSHVAQAHTHTRRAAPPCLLHHLKQPLDAQ